MGILNNFEKYTENDCNVKGQAGRDGIGFKLTDDGNYDIDGKRLTNVADSIDDSDAVSLKVLKEHTQVSQNNYHLQPSFEFFENFGDKRKIVIGQSGNPDFYQQIISIVVILYIRIHVYSKKKDLAVDLVVGLGQVLK